MEIFSDKYVIISQAYRMFEFFINFVVLLIHVFPESFFAFWSVSDFYRENLEKELAGWVTRTVGYLFWYLFPSHTYYDTYCERISILIPIANVYLFWYLLLTYTYA